MTNPSGGPSFLDKKTVIAMLLVGACWLGWNSYMNKKYPDLYKKQPATAEGQSEAPKGVTAANDGNPATTPETQGAPSAPEVSQNIPETFTRFEDERMSFEISSKGMGLKDVRLKKYKDRSGEPIRFDVVNGRLPFETRLTGEPKSLDFNIEKVGDLNFVGKAQHGSLTITKTIEIDTSKYLLKTRVGITGTGTPFLGVTTDMTIPLLESQGSSIFAGVAEVQEFMVVTEGSDERLKVTTDESVEENYSKVSVASLGNQYFSQAIVDRSQIIPELKAKAIAETKSAIAEINYPSLGTSEGFGISYEAFLGPKDLDLLVSVDENLASVIDYGWFTWLAKKILFFLKWFYEMVGNWGVAIILLTIFVRLLVLPLYVMSFKSMNKMKAIQPQIQSLRERLKDDPTRMNQEMMALMRDNKVNPIGGCLPMLLQFPVFIALYQVLHQSIELYQVPFFGWIQDLSLKDPYYIFPALMGISMFIQQKITPTTLDPVQAKVLMFMPLIFILFMLNLPSGLALYMFVSALLGIAQQLLFMKNDEPTLAAAK